MAEDPTHITTDQTYLTLLLGRIDGKLDSALARMDTLEDDHGSLEERVSTLERWRAYILGAAALAGAAASHVIEFVTKGMNA